MPKAALTKNKISKIIKLRSEGFPLKEISRLTKTGVGSVCKYAKDVTFTEKGKSAHERKRFPSRFLSQQRKKDAGKIASKLLPVLSHKEKFIIALALYWGEGTKKDFNIINGDPLLVKAFLNGLEYLDIPKDRVRISVRYYDGQNKEILSEFWLKMLGLDKKALAGYERVASKGQNKLEYGMCRLRISRPSIEHKKLIALIDRIKMLS